MSILDKVVKLLSNRKYQERIVRRDLCPKCGGELDTGWECNDCGYDAKPIADTMKLP